MRGQAIALRTKFGQAVIPVVTISAGLAITFIPSTDEQRLFLYQIFFIAAFILGIIEILMFNKLQVPEYMRQREEASKNKEPRTNIKKILNDKRFRTFFIPAIIFLFTWQAGWPLAHIFFVNELQANELWFAIIALVTGLSAFLSGGFWQRLLQKRGNTFIFLLSGTLLATNMFIFPLVNRLEIIAAVHIITGFCAVGINTSLLNGVLEATPDENRLMYLAVYNTALNLSLFVSPFFSFMLFETIGIHLAMVTIGTLRLTATGFAWLMLTRKQPE
jgi:predicted MFS family arabinose efflux permease